MPVARLPPLPTRAGAFPAPLRPPRSAALPLAQGARSEAAGVVPALSTGRRSSASSREPRAPARLSWASGSQRGARTVRCRVLRSRNEGGGSSVRSVRE